MKNEFDMIGVTAIKCCLKNNRWGFDYEGKFYDMAPANFTDYMLNPLVIGVDRLINVGCSKKGIENPEKGINILFSQNYFPNADVKFTYDEMKFDGWIYKVEELNLKGLLPGQCAWICPYMGFYFKNPPDIMYIKMESFHP
jgi:hypothetical protein